MMLYTIALVVVGVILVHQVVLRLLRRGNLLRFPAPACLSVILDSQLRKRFQPPEELAARSGIREGMQVLDLGCGSGAMTPGVARVVGPQGRVYALDIQVAMLRRLRAKLAKPENQDLRNLAPVIANAQRLPFRDESLDLVYSLAAIQEMPNPQEALQEVKRVLKPDGILAITEIFPDPDYPLRSTTIRMGERAGFVVDDSAGSFFNYTVRFRLRR